MLRRSPSALLAAFGTATLVAGTVAGIAPGFLTDPDKCTIILSRNTPGGTLGFLTAPVANRGAADTTFTITSTNAADVSTVNWLAIPKQQGLASSTEFVNTASLRRSPSGLFVRTGYATLVAGTKTVSDVPMGPNARVYLLAATIAGTSGKLSAPVASVNPTAGTFVINSDSGTDTSVVAWAVIDQPPRFSQSGPQFAQAKGTMVAGAATFTRMDPANLGDNMIVLASRISSGTPGNLAAPLGGTRVNGSIGITSTAAETSLIEVVGF